MTFGTTVKVALGGLLLLTCPVAGQDHPRRLPPVEPPSTESPHTKSPHTKSPHTATRAGYFESASQQVPFPEPLAAPPALDPIPANPSWWEQHISDRQRQGTQQLAVTTDELVVLALMYSEHVLAVRENPQIREQGIIKALADFDPAVFFESRWDDADLPVGNVLTTGGPRRLLTQNWQNRGGMRQKSRRGGTLELAQEIGAQDSNSLFFLPRQQAPTKMVLRFNQPLLKHAGLEYNEGLILLAELETGIAQDELTRQLQDHAYDVLESYWNLYLQRALYLQRVRSFEQASTILQELINRQQIDSLRSQIARARAAAAVRRAALQRAALSGTAAQARIVALTNEPSWQFDASLELAPSESPLTTEPFIELSSAVQSALSYRPEVAATMKRIREAEVRLGMSRNELKPQLDLYLESYVAGLDGNYDVVNALRNQFNDGAPSYGAGVLFQVPLGNRAAQSEFARRQRELSQLFHELNAVLSQVSLQVATAITDLEAAYVEMQGRYEAMRATNEEVKYLEQRWQMLPGDDRAVSFALEDLLDAQDRQMEAESALVHAQVEYMMARYRLKRSVGTLLFADMIPTSDWPPPAPMPPPAPVTTEP